MEQGSAPTARPATRAEVTQAITALTAADTERLEQAAENRITRIGRLAANGRSAEDLLQEAVTRLLDGTRHWYPDKIGFVQCLAGVIRSIASEWAGHRKRNKETPEYADLESQLIKEDDEGNEISPFDSVEAPQLNAERQLIDEELRAEWRALADAIETHFSDDENATCVLLGWGEGMDGPAIQKEFRLDSTMYKSIVRRIKRHSKKIMEERDGKKD